MQSRPSNPATGLLLSGGLDSCILLGHMVRTGCPVRPFYVRSRLVWEREELAAVRRFMQALDTPHVQPLVCLELPVDDLYRDHWSLTGRDTPDATSPDEAVYLPGRNALLVIKAALWCRMHDLEQLALAVLRSNPFGDAKAEFFSRFESALECATGGRVRIVRPFAQMGKREVMSLGRELPLQLTFSCISPVGGLHCGRCNKCAERSGAFRLAGMPDPTEYASPVPVG